jgi:hypothetical protein
MWLTVLLQLIPTLIKIAEAIFAQVPKSGEDKKALVLGVVDNLVAVADNTFSGGAKETWAAIRPNVGVVVDATANIIFPPHPAGGAFGSN